MEEEVRCPICNVKMEEYQHAGLTQAKPKDGDPLICHGCGSVLRITEGDGVEIPDQAIVNKWMGQPGLMGRIGLAQQFIFAMIRKKEREKARLN